MNTLQAIEGLHRLRMIAGQHIEDDYVYGDYCDAIRAAINALKKSTPMKPYWNIVHYPNRTSMGIVQCPMCKRKLRMNKMTKNGDAYCPDCGQAIDWESEDPPSRAEGR